MLILYSVGLPNLTPTVVRTANRFAIEGLFGGERAYQHCLDLLGHR